MCASFEKAVVDVLIFKTMKAARQFKVKTVMIGGGVAANLKLRTELRYKVEGSGRKFLVPDISLCTDNAVMVALAACYLKKKGDYTKIKADPNWELK